MSRRVDVRLAPLAALAALNIGAGASLTLAQTARLMDVQTVHAWCRAWLVDATRLYTIAGSVTDYPPNAIVILAPLSLVNWEWLRLIWIVLILALTPLAVYLVVRATVPGAHITTALLPMLLFCCWGGIRGAQFSRLCLTLAFAAVVWADRRTLTAGACLGLALMKPHIAGPIALWALFTGRFRVVASATALVCGAVVIYALRVDHSPILVLSNYAHVLSSMYTGPDSLMGRTSLRPWLHVIAGGPHWGDVLWGLGAASLLVVPCRMAIAESRRPSPRSAPAVLAIFCLWSLLSVFHLTHGFVLMLPAFVFLLLVDDPASFRERMKAAAVIQVALMLEIPVHLPLAVSDPRILMIAADADRVLVACTFAYVFVIWRRLRLAEHAGTWLATSVPSTRPSHRPDTLNARIPAPG
jgi:hypothetical protein